MCEDVEWVCAGMWSGCAGMLSGYVLGCGVGVCWDVE